MKFYLGRILGNELPPRDDVGCKIQCLKWILNHEPKLENCVKFWLINQVFDEELKQQYIDLLRSYNQTFYIVEFPKNSYLSKEEFKDKINIAININRARNILFEKAQENYDFILPFDGDCFFNADSWKEMTAFIEDDQKKNNYVQYYLVTMYRVNCSIENYKETEVIAEPQVCVRKDGKLRFNENSVFGESDKIEYIRRIGVTYSNQKKYQIKDRKVKTCDRVYHICLGDFSSDQTDVVRWSNRKLSLTNFISKIDEQLK